MELKTCCITGHRNISADKLEYVEQELLKEILQATQDGYRCFISGFAEGTDQIFACIITELKSEIPDLKLEAAIPYQNRLHRLNKSKETKELLGNCDMVSLISEEYSRDCFMKRNIYMVENSTRVIAVYDGRNKGGTFQTIRYARVNGKAVRVVSI